jgi:hypothetical protein
MKNKLTIKQRKFIKEYARTGNGTQSVLSAYNIKNKQVASNYSTELIKKPLIKKSIEQVLNRSGLDLDSISDKVGSILHSEIKEVKANDALRAADILYRLHNAYPASKSISARFNITKKYEDMKYQEVLKELDTIRHKTNKMLNDTEAT